MNRESAHCGLTVLRTTDPSQHATKIWKPGPIESAEHPLLWYARQIDGIEGIEGLSEVLTELEADTRSCVVRGVPRGTGGSYIRRTKYHPQTKPDGTLEDIPRQWCLIDIDSEELPEGTDPLGLDAVRYVCSQLPECFRDTTCHYQFSCSAGFKPGARLHLWFWLDRPVDSDELKAYLKSEVPIADSALANAVQIHYTAKPILIGVADPLNGIPRSGLLEGSNDEVVFPEPKEVIRTPTRTNGTCISGGIDHHLERIGDNRDGFHGPIRDALACLAATDGPDADLDEFREMVWKYVEEAEGRPGGGTRSPEYIEEKMSEAEWQRALEKFSEQTPKSTAPRKGKLVEGIQPRYELPEPVTLEQGRRKIGQVLDEWFERGSSFQSLTPDCPAALYLKVTPGVGKTYGYLQLIKRQREKYPEFTAWIFVPRIMLGNQIVQDHGEGAYLIKGRLQELEGEPLCRKHDLVRQVQATRGVYKTLCERIEEDGEGHRCEHIDECAYFRQYREANKPGSTVIMAHEYAFIPSQRLTELPRPDLIVFDESFYSTAIQEKEDSVESFLSSAGSFRELAQKIVGALASVDPVFLLLAEGITSEKLREAHSGLWAEASGDRVLPTDSPSVIKQKLSASPGLGIVPDVFMGLATELDLGKQRFDSVYVKNGMVYTQSRKPLEIPTDVPVLITDATGSRELLQPIFGERTIEEVEVSVKRNLHVIQVVGFNAAKSVLTRRQDTPKRLKEIEGVLNKYVEENPGKKVLVVTYKKTEELLKLPESCTIRHFNGLRGDNDLKDFDTVVIIGRIEPRPEDIERKAYGLLYDQQDADLELLGDGQWYPGVPQGFCMTNGELLGWSEVSVHPDPLCQRILEAHREDEIIQAIDRIRSVSAEETKETIIVTNVPLPIQVERLVDYRRFVGDLPRLEQAFIELGEVIPLKASWLSEKFPDLWASTDVARKDIERNAGVLKGTICYKYLLQSVLFNPPPPIMVYTFRLQGQRGRPTRCFSVHSLETTRERLVSLLGEEVTLIEHAEISQVVQLRDSPVLPPICQCLVRAPSNSLDFDMLPPLARSAPRSLPFNETIEELNRWCDVLRIPAVPLPMLFAA